MRGGEQRERKLLVRVQAGHEEQLRERRKDGGGDEGDGRGCG